MWFYCIINLLVLCVWCLVLLLVTWVSLVVVLIDLIIWVMLWADLVTLFVVCFLFFALFLGVVLLCCWVCGLFSCVLVGRFVFVYCDKVVWWLCFFTGLVCDGCFYFGVVVVCRLQMCISFMALFYCFDVGYLWLCLMLGFNGFVLLICFD